MAVSLFFMHALAIIIGAVAFVVVVYLAVLVAEFPIETLGIVIFLILAWTLGAKILGLI